MLFVESIRHSPTLSRLAFAAFLAGLLAACNRTEEHSFQEPRFSAHAASENTDAARFEIFVYGGSDPSVVPDFVAAGMLPMRIITENRGASPVRLVPRQTFLIDVESQAWPLLTADQALNRLTRLADAGPTVIRNPKPEELDSLTGFALNVSAGPELKGQGESFSKQVKTFVERLSDSALQNRKIAPKELGAGIMFFPFREEAKGAHGLRICYEQDGRQRFVTVWFDAPAPPSAKNQQ